MIVVLGGLSALGPLSIDAYLPGVPRVTSALDAGPTAVQLTLTACVIGLAVGQLVIGPVSDALGRRRPLLACLTGFFFASLACVAAPSIAVLIGARLVVGISGAGGVVIARAMVRDLFTGAEAGRVYSDLSAIVTAAPVFAPLAGAGILLFADWRAIFVALAAIGAVLLAAALLLTEETLPAEGRASKALGRTAGNIVVLLRHRPYISFVLAGGLGFGALFSYISASSFVYQDHFGMSAQLYAVLFATNGFALMSSYLVNSRLVASVGSERLLRYGLGGLTLGSCAIALEVLADLGPALVLPTLLFTVSNVGFVIANSVTLAMAGEASRAGTAAALFGLFQFSVGAGVAPLVGVAAPSPVPMGLTMAAAATLALTVYLSRPPREPLA